MPCRLLRADLDVMFNVLYKLKLIKRATLRKHVYGPNVEIGVKLGSTSKT